jgi:uncharacterized protein YceK
MRAVFPLMLACGCLGLTGCVGTFSTRANGVGDWAGAYPGMAVAADVCLMGQGASELPSDLGRDVLALAIISTPIDLALDTALLPVDLLLWPFGFSKVASASGL